MGNVQTKKWDDELVEGVVRLGAVGPEVRSKRANTASKHSKQSRPSSH